MKVTIAKWGNSTAVRLPKSVSQDLGLVPGVQLDLVVQKDGILLRTPAKSSKDLLAEMVAEMKRLGPENEPESVDWGPDRGSEIIDDAYSRGEITLQDILKRRPASKSRSASPSRKQSNASRRRRHRVG